MQKNSTTGQPWVCRSLLKIEADTFDNSPTARYREHTFMKESIKNNVHELRTKAGVTQEAFAESVGVSRQTIIAVEKGNYTPSIALALKIASFFKTPVEKIFSIHYEK